MSAAVDSTPRSVYIHVPFCLHRCGYCDFTLVAKRDHLIPQYLQALSNELATLNHRHEVDTIFVGGGTPTHLNVQQLRQLFSLIHQHFQLADNAEFTVEANPDGLDSEKLALLQEQRVNRLSLGVQSFDAECLSILERQHTPDEAIETIRRCQQFFANLSLDLIFAVPGQSEKSWQLTLSTATSLAVNHISTYGLTYEQGTAFFRRESHGQLQRIPEETERTQYLTSIDHLTARGFHHYEVSNFAQPGFACRHNQTYWNGNSYLAFGPGAARYVGGVRETNSRSVAKWLNSWTNNRPCLDESETLSDEEKAREAIMLGLRMTAGLDLTRFERRFGFTVETLEPVALNKHLIAGLLVKEHNFLKLSRDGLLLADSVVSDFL